MKITALRSYRAGGSTVLRVDTDERFIGYGECRVLPAAERALLLAKAPGREVSSFEVLRVELAGAPAAQSALNMALLDLLGKKAGVPVYQILGGATRAKVRVMAPIAGDGAAQVKAGHRALVVPLLALAASSPRHDYVSRVVAQLEGLRRGLGDNVDFVLDAGGELPPAIASSLAAAVERFHPLWFDEPCALLNLAAVRKIARENVTPLGFGRNIVQPSQVADLFREQSIDILRLDIRKHGISGIRRLAALAETYYAAVAPYNDGGPVASAAAIQLAASLPNFFIQQLPATLNSDYASGPPLIDNGYIPLPTAPGLGVTINIAALDRYQEAA